jgi:hypothetical protein
MTFSYSLVLKIGGQVVKLALMIFPYNATCFYFMVLAYYLFLFYGISILQNVSSTAIATAVATTIAAAIATTVATASIAMVWTPGFIIK